MPTASNVVDSSAWLEFLADGPNAEVFAPAIEAVGALVVPTLVITEVARRLDAQGKRRLIPQIIGHMRQGRVVVLDEHLALEAALIGRQHGLALADSIVYATAQQVRGIVWTQDADFRELPGVEYRAHRKSRGVSRSRGASVKRV